MSLRSTIEESSNFLMADPPPEGGGVNVNTNSTARAIVDEDVFMESGGSAEGPFAQLATSEIRDPETSYNASAKPRYEPLEMEEIPGQKSGLGLNENETSSRGGRILVYMKEPYSSWKRQTNRPSGEKDGTVDACVVGAGVIIFLGLIAIVVWICVVATSPRQSNVYTVDSIILPADQKQSKEDAMSVRMDNVEALAGGIKTDLATDTQELIVKLRRLGQAELDLIKTAMADRFCSKQSLESVQSKDDGLFRRNPTFTNCRPEISIANEDDVNDNEIFQGGTCDIVCPENDGFFSLKDIAAEYANVSTKIVCNANSGTDAYWSMMGSEAQLEPSNLPLCYRRHCPKDILDPEANFKCSTVAGPFSKQIVIANESCVFVGCVDGAERRSGVNGDSFQCGEDGAFHPEKPGSVFPDCVKTTLPTVNTTLATTAIRLLNVTMTTSTVSAIPTFPATKTTNQSPVNATPKGTKSKLAREKLDKNEARRP